MADPVFAAFGRLWDDQGETEWQLRQSGCCEAVSLKRFFQAHPGGAHPATAPCAVQAVTLTGTSYVADVMIIDLAGAFAIEAYVGYMTDDHEEEQLVSFDRGTIARNDLPDAVRDAAQAVRADLLARVAAD